MVETYRNCMEQAARTDIAAAAAAHRELGPDYDAAVAEGLIERISDEIDKRVDARLGTSPRSSRSPAETSRSAGDMVWLGGVVGAGIGAGITGIAAGVAASGDPRVEPVVIAVWMILAVIALVMTAVRKSRNK